MDTAAVDLEIVDKIEVKDDEFFHLEDIKNLSLQEPYQVSRLFLC